MKKLIISIVFLFTAVLVIAQEKGLYLTVAGGLGANNLRYRLNNDFASRPKLGLGGNVGVQYFFTEHWGIASGIGVSFYHSKATYSNSSNNDRIHYAFKNMHDNDLIQSGSPYQNFTLLLSLSNWKEVQQAYFFEIPIMIMYQTKWGDSDKWGMYCGVGPKIQFPAFSQNFSVDNGSELSVSAYYEAAHMTLPDPRGPDVSNHGYGTNSQTGFSGTIDLKTSIALSGEIGLLRKLNQRTDFMLGIYLDYGLNNIKKGNKTDPANLISPLGNSNTIHPANHVGDNMQYNGFINSHAVSNVHLTALGGKIGIRIKLGKIKQEDVPKNDFPVVMEKDTKETNKYIIWVLDSLTRTPIATKVSMTCKDCPKGNNQSFYSSSKDTTTLELHPNNTYLVSITKDGFPVYNTELKTNPSQKDITLFMPLHPRITGIVKNTKNNMLSEVDIWVKTTTDKMYTAKTNEEGFFMIPTVDAGTHYTIIASKTGYDSDTINFDIPAAPDKLQPSYVIMKLNTADILLHPTKKIVISALVLFDLDKYALYAQAKKEINAIIEMLKENPEIEISVDGHTDAQGSATHNQTLSENRANSVRKYLIEKGIEPSRIRAHGYGATRLLNHCKPNAMCNDEEHQENRRVEFLFKEK